MSIVTIIWSMSASACLTLAFIHGIIWWRQPGTRANLFFSFAAIGTAAFAMCELAMMRASTVAAMSAAFRWLHVPVWVIFVSIAGFVHLFFMGRRAWLGWLACGMRTVSLVLNFTTGECLNYRHVTGLRHVRLFGESTSVAEGIVNPWVLVGQLSLLLLVVYVADAALAAWRRGERRRAAVVGGSIVLFVLIGIAESIIVFRNLAHWPVTVSLFYLGIVAAMSFELGIDLLEAQSNRERVARLLRAASLGELSAAIAHELNQPLAAILSNAQAAQRFLAQDKWDANEIRQILGDIVADDRRASEVIRRLRMLLKKETLRARTVSANDLVNDALKLMNGELRAQSISVITQLADDLPPVHGDPVQLQQVLINLILNAKDAMALQPPGDRTLSFSTAGIDGNFVQICVADSGSGIPPGSEEEIFEPYHTTKADGLGLGLSLSRSIAAAHGGRLWVKDGPAGGTMFCFTIPASAAIESKGSVS